MTQTSFWRFLGRRSLQAVFVLWAAATLFFYVSRVLPGDPARALFGFRRPTPEQLEAVREFYGLDQSLWTQYLEWMGGLLHGDLGFSIRFGHAPIRDLVEQSAGITLRLLLIAAIGQLVIGLLAGMWQGRARARTARHSTRLLVMLAVSVPMLVIAHVAHLLVVEVWHVLPATPDTSRWVTFVVPGAVLSLVFGGYVALVADESIERTMHAPFVATSTSKGMSRRRLLWVHALRPSLTPVITVMGANLSQIVTALLIVEIVFGLPGLGFLTYEAVRFRDYAFIVAVGLITTFLVIVVNFIADVLAAVADPRFRLN